MPDLTQVNTYGTAVGTNSTNAFVTHFDTRSPTPQDVNWPVQKRWVNLTTHGEYILANFVSFDGVVTANWISLGGGLASTESLTGNSGGPVPPTGNNINVLGDTTTINIVGVPATSTLTANVILPATPHVTLVGETSSIAGVGPGTSTYVLTSNGVASDPSYQPVSASGAIISIDGDTGVALPSAGEITVSGGTTGLTTAASGHTVDLTGILGIANGGTNASSFTQTNGITAYNGTSIVNYAGPQLSSAGVMTNTTQPCFVYATPAKVMNVTGDGTTVTVVFSSKIFDNDSNCDGTTFTAPVTGNYLLETNINILGHGTSTAQFVTIITDTLSYSNFSGLNYNQNGDTSVFVSGIVPMSAGDTAYVQLIVYGGTKNVGYFEGCTFGGYLIC